MNREEQIEAVAFDKAIELNEYRKHNSTSIGDIAMKAFIAGAEWADAHPKNTLISVKDRLPQKDDDLYIALNVKMNPPGCGVCEFDPLTKIWTNGRGYIVNPTHWMFIPFHPFDKRQKDIKEKEDCYECETD